MAKLKSFPHSREKLKKIIGKDTSGTRKEVTVPLTIRDGIPPGVRAGVPKGNLRSLALSGRVLRV